MSTFTIDFFELAFLAEACVPPQPIARHCFWMDLCDKHYHAMTADERAKLYDWIKRSTELSGPRTHDSEDYQYFLARYNPENQYSLDTDCIGMKEKIDAFLFKGKYHTKKNQWINEDYITKITKI